MNMILIRWGAYVAIAVALVVGGFFGGWHHARQVDAARAATTAASIASTAAAAAATARQTEHRNTETFADIASGYLKEESHAYPSIANVLPAAVAAGTMQLRNACPEVPRGDVPGATTRSRIADAAATQALADRTNAAIAAVRAGDAADARERRLGAQVTALQAVLAAERQP